MYQPATAQRLTALGGLDNQVSLLINAQEMDLYIPREFHALSSIETI